MLNDHCGLLLVDEPNDFRNELLRIALEQGELVHADALQNRRDRAPRQNGPLCDLPDEVVSDLACLRVPERLRPRLLAGKGLPPLDLMLVHLRFLAPNGRRVAQFGNKELRVYVGNGLADQLGAVKLDRVGVLVVDLTPQGLKLFLGEVLVQRVLLDLGFVSVGEHLSENAVVIDRLDERMDAVCHRLEFFRQFHDGSVPDCLAVLVRHLAVHVHIAVLNEVELDGVGFLVVNQRRHVVHLDVLALEVFACRHRGPIVEDGLDVRLQVRHKGLVAFAGDHRQRVDFVNAVAAALDVHAGAVLIDAEPQPATDFLPLRRIAVGMLQRADLEHVRIVPPFAQGGVGEDEPRRLLKGQQPFLVLQNQVIG